MPFYISVYEKKRTIFSEIRFFFQQFVRKKKLLCINLFYFDPKWKILEYRCVTCSFCDLILLIDSYLRLKIAFCACVLLCLNAASRTYSWRRMQSKPSVLVDLFIPRLNERILRAIFFDFVLGYICGVERNSIPIKIKGSRNCLSRAYCIYNTENRHCKLRF